MDHLLLGMKLWDKFFVDLVLPLGRRSAPFIFTAIVDMVEWLLVHNHGVNFLCHYLDDFSTLEPLSSPVCLSTMHIYFQLCSKLGLPLHPGKLEGLSTRLTILSIKLNLTSYKLTSWLREIRSSIC